MFSKWNGIKYEITLNNLQVCDKNGTKDNEYESEYEQLCEGVYLHYALKLY